MTHRLCVRAAVCALTLSAGLASNALAQDLVYRSNSDNGFFTPFNTANANAGLRYGDGGWILGPEAPPVTIGSLVLKLATFGGSAPGLTDLTVTFNDGNPGGLVFGSGAALYSTTITGITLPALTPNDPIYFDVIVPIPAVNTLGDFNNVGFSVGVSNFNFNGSFGFQAGVSSSPGFLTNNASFFDGTSWSLFSFGGTTQLAFELYTVPAPQGAGLLALAGLVTLRRRR